MYYELIVLGLVCFLAPWLARLGGYEASHKPFDFVGIGGIFFLLTAALSLGAGFITFLAGLGKMLSMITFLLGALGLVVGAVWETIGVLQMAGHGLAHKTM